MKLEDLFKEKAQEKQRKEGKKLGGNITLSQKSVEGSFDTQKELEGVSMTQTDIIKRQTHDYEKSLSSD